MAVQGPIPVEFGQVFPRGVFAAGGFRRAVDYCVVAALQDPRKEVLNIRNLFPDKIALRLDEPSQVDMVLGDGARDRGARCDDISSDPVTGAGVGFIRLEADPDPVRVRAAYVSDDDIRAMNLSYTPGPA